jgi:membrane peptidoglycan carboxypeptidase
MAVGVWVGNDDNTPMNGVTGGDIPARMFQEFTEQALKRRARAVATAPARAGERTVERAEAAGAVLRGRADVIDTATLAIDGKQVALFGVEVNPDRRAARALAQYLRRREVQCAPAQEAGTFRCLAAGRDLAEVILASGVAAASAGASEDLMEIEETARAQRVGIWRRGGPDPGR